MVQKQKFSASTWLDVSTLKKVDLLEDVGEMRKLGVES